VVRFDEKVHPLSFEEPTVNSNTLLAMMMNTALLHIPVGTFFKSHGTSSHFFSSVRSFLDRELFYH
jgi:hypothetical protein